MGPVRDRRSRETQRPDKVEERKVFGGRREVEMEQRGEKASHSGPPRRPPPPRQRPRPGPAAAPGWLPAPPPAPSPTPVPTPASAAPTWAAHALPAAAPPPRRPPASSRGPGPAARTVRGAQPAQGLQGQGGAARHPGRSSEAKGRKREKKGEKVCHRLEGGGKCKTRQEMRLKKMQKVRKEIRKRGRGGAWVPPG